MTTSKKIDYPGFWAVMPHNTKIAFISFLIGKFVFCPLFLVLLFVSNFAAGAMLVMWGITITVAVIFALIEMFGK